MNDVKKNLTLCVMIFTGCSPRNPRRTTTERVEEGGDNVASTEITATIYCEGLNEMSLKVNELIRLLEQVEKLVYEISESKDMLKPHFTRD